MSEFTSNVPVLIVGAGPTGLTTGLLLASYGVRSIILDRNAAEMDIPRAIVLDDEGARTLQVFGGHRRYLEKTVVGNGAAYLNDLGEVFARVGKGPETYGFAKRHFMNQPELERDLHACISDSSLCDLRFGCTVQSLTETPHCVTVSFDDPDGTPQKIEASYVVAADGGRSPIRERLGIAMTGSTYEQDWIIVDTMNDPDEENHSKFICSSTRPHVSIPAPHGGRRYEFMLLPGESHEEALADGFVEGLMLPFREIAQADIVRKTIYTFHARIAERWRVGAILLAGDAAHLTPPFAGQGMNAGLRDAANLSWKIAAILKGRASDAVLDTYGEERKDPAWAMIQLAVVMGDIVMPVVKEEVAFREQILKLLQPFPAVQDYLLQMRFKPRPRFDAGLFLDLHSQPFEASIVGEMIPQPDVHGPDGSIALDELLGSGFALISQNAAGEQAVAALQRDQLMGLPLGKVHLPFQDGPGCRTKDLSARPLRTHRDEVLLIRPDRYCAAAIRPENLDEQIDRYVTLMKK
jgi:3-(3-hydroxy-phenyl)propionate hydroxylase